MPTSAFPSPLTLEAVGYVPDDLETASNDVLRRIGAHTSCVWYGNKRCAAWVANAKGPRYRLVVDNGTTATLTAITASVARLPALNLTGDAVWVLDGDGDALAEVAFDGALQTWLALPARFATIAPLGADRFAAIEPAARRVVMLERADGDGVERSDSLRAVAAFDAPKAFVLRTIGENRLLVGYDELGVVEVWQIDGERGRDRAFTIARFEELGSLCDIACTTDENGTDWTLPAWIGIWDGEEGYALRGSDAQVADPSALTARSTVQLHLGQASPRPRPESPGSDPDPAASPPTIPHVLPESVRSQHLAAIVRAMQSGRRREVPEPALVPLFAGALPDDLRTLLAAAAWHHVPHLSLGEFWWETPRLATSDRAFGSRATTQDAIRIGTIANGDEVVVRVTSGRTRVVELSHEEDTEIDRGSIESFLAHCVEYAHGHEEATSLDPFL